MKGATCAIDCASRAAHCESADDFRLLDSFDAGGGNQPRPDGLGPPVFEDEFWSHRGDGLAELSGYDLMMPRYGQSRKGTAVAIVVTETFGQKY